MKTVCIVQARLSSKRFPEKILADLNGYPLLWHVLRRALLIPGVAGVLLAMPRHTPAEVISAAIDGDLRAVQCVFPPVPEEDVLARYQWAAALSKADAIVRITADCPLLDQQVSALVIERFVDSGAEYAHNLAPESGYPDGLDTQVFTRDLLERAHRDAREPAEREHVCTWMDGRALQVVTRHEGPSQSHRKWSVDSMADLFRIRAILAHVGDDEETDWQAAGRAEDYFNDRPLL